LGYGSSSRAPAEQAWGFDFKLEYYQTPNLSILNIHQYTTAYLH
jgi:hypothetical protein